MEKNSKTLQEKLQHYLDGTLAHEEKESIEKLLREDQTVKNKYDDLFIVDQFLRRTERVEPSADFTQRVMIKVNALPVSQRMPIRSSLIFLLVMVSFMSLVVGCVSLGMFDGVVTPVDLNEMPLMDQYIFKSLPTVSFDVSVWMKTMIFINAAIVLLILDRAVLKPFFQRRLVRN